LVRPTQGPLLACFHARNYGRGAATWRSEALVRPRPRCQTARVERRAEEPRWRVGERVQLQAHLDQTQMGVGVILDIEAKTDGIAKAALVRFEGGPRTGLWYSVGSLEHEPGQRAPAPTPLEGQGTAPLLPKRLSDLLAARRSALEEEGRHEEGEEQVLRGTGAPQHLSPREGYRAPEGRLLDERQLILRGWLFPGARMRALLRQLSLRRSLEGIETERHALDWVEQRLRELGWWRPLQVRPSEPAFLASRDIRNAIQGVLPGPTQDRLESLLRGVQRAGIVRSPAEAAAWLRAWLEVWDSQNHSEPVREPGLPEALQPWDLIQRGWLLDPLRIRALSVKEERARERGEPLYSSSPLGWAYCTLADLGWLRARRPSLEKISLASLPSVRPSQLTGELAQALRQARSAGIVRDKGELDLYAKAWLLETQRQRLGEALEREDLGGALEALGGG
jgi:hypothetical protein